MPVEPLVPFRYRAGSIVTIEVWNFVTYAHAAIHPSSRLNLIVGPNGSGKSSIVCAMCLGLGGQPTLLGRGNHAKDYVKYGETTAAIEISLATGHGNDVVVIKREIKTDESRETETTTWFLGGSHAGLRKCTHKEVKAVVSKYNIQLGNYTQFLPQDIVKEFPALTPQQLLQRTEDALDDSTLKDKHRELIELKAASRERDAEHHMKKESLADLRAQQDKLRSEVETFNEYTRLTAEIEKMKMLLPYSQFEVTQRQAQELQALKNDAKKASKEHDKKVAEADVPLQQQKARKKELDALVKEKGAEKRRKENRHRTAVDGLSQLEEELDEIMDTLKEVDKTERRNEARMAKLEQEIAVQQQQYDALASAHAEDQADATARRQKLTKHKQALLEDQRKANDELSRKKRDGGRLRHEIDRVTDLLQRERDAGGRIMQKLRENRNGGSENLYRLAKLVDENKRLFRKDVYCPIAMHISVRDPQYARFVETVVDKSLRCAFVTQHEHDREALNRLMNDHNIKGIRCINYVGGARTDYSPPVSSQRLKEFGVLCYMDELFDAPEVVKWVLNDTARLHQIAVGSEKAEQQSNNEAIFDAGVQAMVTPNKYTIASRSVHTGRTSFGTRAPNARVEVLVGAGENSKEVDKHTRRISELETELEQLMSSFPSARQRCTDIQKQLTQVSEQLDELQAANRERKSLEQQLKTSQHKLQKLRETPSAAAQRDKLRKDVVKKNDKRLKKLQDLVGSMRGYMTASAEHDLANLNASSMTETIRSLEAAKRLAQDEADRIREEYDEVNEKFKEVKSNLKALQRQVNQNPAPEEFLTYWADLDADHFMNDPDQLKEQIRTDQARADAMVTGGGQEVVQQYKRQEAQILRLQNEFENLEAEKAARVQQMGEIERSWLPALRQRIDKVNAAFSAAMAEMKFCGEIALREAKEDPANPENSAFDYANFAIDIRVQFRENQELRALQKHAQSGGEKSVSTMLYLVSLQELTDFPFRVVDEINQGMDAVNERNMFEQIVRAASREDCPQYFVITPKLLPGLNFNDAVTTHFVWNAPAVASLDFNHKDFNHSKHAVANNPNKRVRTG